MFSPSAPSLLPPRTPPSYHRTGQSSSPSRSSPLNPTYRLQNPPSQRRASVKTHYQTKTRYTRPTHASSAGGAATSESDAPQTMLWRERFKQRCNERAERDRKKYRETRGSGGTSLTDSVFDDDGDMDTEDGDDIDDELFRRIIVSENRRRDRARDLSYIQAMGSSIDPDMEDIEALERDFVGEHERDPSSPPPEEYMEDSEPLGYLDDDEASMDFQMSSPPGSPTPTTKQTLLPRLVSVMLASPCPYCNAPYSLHVQEDQSIGSTTTPSLVCAVCTSVIPLGDAPNSWTASHPSDDSLHQPVAVSDPALSDGILLLCSDDLCEWACAL